MKQIMNQLIQLQDLSFTLDEQKALTTETHLKDLEESIQALTAGLPADIAKLFLKNALSRNEILRESESVLKLQLELIFEL